MPPSLVTSFGDFVIVFFLFLQIQRLIQREIKMLCFVIIIYNIRVRFIYFNAVVCIVSVEVIGKPKISFRLAIWFSVIIIFFFY